MECCVVFYPEFHNAESLCWVSLCWVSWRHQAKFLAMMEKFLRIPILISLWSRTVPFHRWTFFCLGPISQILTYPALRKAGSDSNNRKKIIFFRCPSRKTFCHWRCTIYARVFVLVLQFSNSQKNFSWTNTLAFFAATSVTKKKSFNALTKDFSNILLRCQ